MPDAAIPYRRPLTDAEAAASWRGNRLRSCAARVHVHGFVEAGTSPLDRTALNCLGRCHPALAAMERVDCVRDLAACVAQFLRDCGQEHTRCACRHGDDMPDLRDWRWDAHA